MKIRTGFVSNSSTASFICPICTEHYEIMDGDPTSAPYSLATCKNFHGFCVSHMLGPEDRVLELMKEAVIKSKERDIEGIENMSIEKLRDLFARNSDGDFKDKRLYLFISEFFTSIPEELCPICSFKVIRNHDLMSYLLATVVKEEVADEIRQRFSSFAEFSTFLREKEGTCTCERIDDD